MVTSRGFLPSDAQEEVFPPSSQLSSQGNYINVLQTPQRPSNAAGRFFQGPGSASNRPVFTPVPVPNPTLIDPTNGDRA